MAQARIQTRSVRDSIPDLPSQLESLLDTVWWCERLWKLEDRIEHQIKTAPKKALPRIGA